VTDHPNTAATPPLAAAALIGVSVAVACVLLEVGLRLGGGGGRLMSDWMLGDRHLVVDRDVIVLRDRLLEDAFYAPPTAPLVLAIGDSFTQGFPVSDRDAYPAALQRLLARHGVAADVRNAGMGDSGPDQQLRLLAGRLLPRLRPTVVVWQLFANDVGDNVTRAVYDLDGDRLVPLPADRHWLAVRQRVFAWTPLPRRVKRESRVYQLVLRAVERAWRPPPRDDATAWSLAKIARELDAFDRLADGHGFTGYVMVVPPQAAALAEGDPDRVRQEWSLEDDARLATLLRGRRGVVVAPRAANADADFATAAKDPQPRGVRHLNARGYGRLAATVAHRLVHDGVLRTSAVAPAP